MFQNDIKKTGIVSEWVTVTPPFESEVKSGKIFVSYLSRK
jgi:hypothetical protein